MEQHDHKLIYLTKLQNEIEDKSETFTLDTIGQTREDLYAIILRLNILHNRMIVVNRLIPDVLYNIFLFAVYGSTDPVTAVLHISRVCSHWRKSAIGWPALWTSIDMKKPHAIIDLFVSRSGNAPLSLSWTTEHSFYRFESFIPYLESSAESILPRLNSLTICFDDYSLDPVRGAFHGRPLYLRYLDLRAPEDASSLTDILQIDPSYLQELKLRYLDLPVLEPPPNKLTHFSLSYPTKTPSLSLLLIFLSNSPFLIELEIRISERGQPNPEVISMDSSINPSISNNKTVLPNLKRLILESSGGFNYNYIRELTTRIEFLGPLSQFELTCLNCWSYLRDRALPPLNALEWIPSNIFSSFQSSEHYYLFLHNKESEFAVVSAPNLASGASRNPPFYFSVIDHTNKYQLVDYTQIINWIRAMPQITHLDLTYDAWKIFTSLDMCKAFPSLQTLGIRFARPDEDPNILSVVGLKLRTLKLSRMVLSPDVFLDMVLRTGAEIVEVGGNFLDSEFEHAIATLRNRGVDVTLDWDNENVDIYRHGSDLY